MKISILTSTYNRANELNKVYESLLKNKSTLTPENAISFEWLIMDDGSTDNTKSVVQKFVDENNADFSFEIKYFYHENKGKMESINELVEKATGDLMFTCDSDDYLTDKALNVISENYEKYKNENIYAMCFHRSMDGFIGDNYKKEFTTLFDLHFKDGKTGEDLLVFISKVRKQYKHKLEHNEKFITEARLYYEMDEKYNIVCINETLMIGSYKNDGYTKNISNQIKKSPFGYYEYFKEILEKDFKGVLWNKRLYAIKHYILFATLTNSKNNVKSIRNLENKFLYCVLYIPGKISTKIRFK